MTRVTRWWPLLLALTGIGLLGWTAIRVLSVPDEDPAADLEDEEDWEDEPITDLLEDEHYQKVIAKEVDVYETFTGRVKGEGTIEVRAPQGMRVPVVEIHHLEGDFVAEGDPLLTFDRTQIEKAIEEARERGDSSAVERFEGFLEHAVIRAPRDAQVLSVWVDQGNTPVDVGIPLMTLADRSSYSFVVMLPEEVVRRSAAIGTRLRIELIDGLGEVMGTVNSLGDTSEGRMVAVGGYVHVILGLDEHEGLEQDLTGTIHVPASKQVAGLVPKKAVVFRDEVPVVRVFENGEILERTLRLDGEEGDWYVVLYGVNVGESVVVPGPAP